MVFIRSFAAVAGALAMQAAAAPAPQATAAAGGAVTAYLAPPGLPNATYVAVGTGTAGDVTLVAARVATVSSKATTVYDGIDLGPTNVAAIEFDAGGAILQGFNCVRVGNASVTCSGALVNPTTTRGYVYGGNATAQVLTPTGLEALPSGILTVLPSLQAGALAFSSAAAQITSGVTLQALPGFVGQSVANGTASGSAAAATSAPASSAAASRA